MDTETRKSIQALCSKLGHEWVIYTPSLQLKPNYKELRCKICDITKKYDR